MCERVCDAVAASLAATSFVIKLWKRQNIMDDALTHDGRRSLDVAVWHQSVGWKVIDDDTLAGIVAATLSSLLLWFSFSLYTQMHSSQLRTAQHRVSRNRREKNRGPFSLILAKSIEVSSVWCTAIWLCCADRGVISVQNALSLCHRRSQLIDPACVSSRSRAHFMLNETYIMAVMMLN